MVKHPGFFMFYLPFLGDEALQIPSRFVQSIEGTWPPRNLALRDLRNNLWHVKVELGDGDWYFTDGWTKFADDNMIEGGDLLVFENSSEGILDFKVHDGSGCLKGVKGQKTINTEEHALSMDQDDYEEGNWQSDSLEREQVMDDDTDDNDYIPMTEEETSSSAFAQENEVMNARNHMQTTQMDQETIQPEGPTNDNPQASNSKRKRRRECDWYGEKIFKTGLIPRPTTPYFVTKINKHRRSELFIPMDVIQLYDLKLPIKILLRDPAGRKFDAKRKVWADQRTFYTGGWRSLCKLNIVGDEDYCICEFGQDNSVLCISVSFFRSREQ